MPSATEPPVSEVPCPLSGSNNEVSGIGTVSPFLSCMPMMTQRQGCLSGQPPTALSLSWDLGHSLGLGWLDVVQVIVHPVVEKAHNGGPRCRKAEGHRHLSACQQQSAQPNPLAQQCTVPALTPKSGGGGGESEGLSGVEFCMSLNRNSVTLQLWI